MDEDFLKGVLQNASWDGLKSAWGWLREKLPQFSRIDERYERDQGRIEQMEVRIDRLNELVIALQQEILTLTTENLDLRRQLANRD